MRIIETKVYTFDELSEKAKERAIDKWYENEDFSFLEDYLKDSLEAIAPYWENTRLYYSLSNCQGDGLSFSGVLNLEKFLQEFFPNLRHKKAVLSYIYKISSSGNTGQYRYASLRDISLEENYTKKGNTKRLDKIADDILEKVQSEYVRICKELEKEGYGIIEYRMTEREFSEHCEVNEYEFYEDGKMV